MALVGGSSTEICGVALGEREVLVSPVAACGRGPGRGGEEQEQEEGRSKRRHTEGSAAGLRPGQARGRSSPLSSLLGLFKTASVPPCCRMLTQGRAWAAPQAAACRERPLWGSDSCVASR